MSTPYESILVVTTPTVNNLPHVVIGPIASTGGGGYYDMAFKAATHEMRLQAEKIGADAVVGLIMQVATLDPNTHLSSTRVYLSGTAVKLPWPSGTASPELYSEQQHS